MISGVTRRSQADAGAAESRMHLGARLNPETGKKAVLRQPLGDRIHQRCRCRHRLRGLRRQRLLVKLNVDASGALISFTSGLANQTRYIDLNNPANPATSGANAGKNPLGIVIRNLGAGQQQSLRHELHLAQRVGGQPRHRQLL